MPSSCLLFVRFFWNICYLSEVSIIVLLTNCNIHFTEIESRGRASQSSTHSSFHPASKAIDGRINTFSHTHRSDTEPWWRIEFDDVMEFHHIKIYNRHECCQERLDDFSIYYGDILNSQQKCVSHQDMGMISSKSFTCGECIVTGKYLKIMLHNNNILNLGEVEIYGSDKASRFA